MKIFTRSRFYFCAFLAVALAGLSVEALAQQVSFTYQKPKKGDVQTSALSVAATMTMNVRLNGNPIQTVNIQKNEVKEKSTTVLEAGDVITKAKVRYTVLRRDEINSARGSNSSNSSAVGKTFIVEIKDGVLTIADASDKPVDQEVAEDVRDDHKRFGKPQPLSRLFDGKTFNVGDKVEVPEAIMLDMLDAGEKSQIANIEFTLTGLRKENDMECAVVQVTFKLHDKTNPALSFNADLKGEFIIGVKNCWPVSMILEGPMTMSGTAPAPEGQKVDFDGGGTMKISVGAGYGK